MDDSLGVTWSVVPEKNFNALIEQFKGKCHSWVVMLSTVQRIKSGAVEGNIFTNGWPKFSSLVLQCRSKELVVLDCYVLVEPDRSIIESFAEQLHKIIRSEERLYWIFANAGLAKDLQPLLQLKATQPGLATPSYCVDVLADLIFYYIPVTDVSTFTKEEPLLVPDDYVLRKLEDRHLEVVSTVWEYPVCGGIIPFLTDLVKLYHSVGVFTRLPSGITSETPVGWCLQYPNGEVGSLYVVEEHRRKGLAKIMVQHMCKLVVEDGEIPFISAEKNNFKPISLFLNVGFVELGNCVNLFCM